MQRRLPCCNPGMDTHVFQVPELRHIFSSHEGWGRWGLSASPSSQTWASAPSGGEGGLRCPVDATHPYMMQPRVGHSVFQGLKLRHLLHMRDGVAAKRRSGFERALTRAHVFELGHLCIYSSWALNLPWSPQSVIESKFNRQQLHRNHFWKSLLFVKFENKRKRKDTCAHKCWQRIAPVFLQGWIFTREPSFARFGICRQEDFVWLVSWNHVTHI